MPRYIAIILSLLLCLSAVGCTANEEPAQPVDVTAPAETAAPAEEAPPADSASEAITVYFPEDATEETANYKLTYLVPTFESAALNAAVSAFVDELYTRVTSERMPLADRVEGEAVPSTTVSCAVQTAELPDGEYTNLVFTETATYGNISETDIHTIVASPAGNECSLGAVSGVYSPEAIAAQQVWNIIDREADSYFGDLTVEDVMQALDLFNGFTVAEEGYTVYIPAGVLADEGAGMLEFSFARNALYPGFVGDVISAEEYEAILPVISACAKACGPGYTGFSGEPDAELAASIVNYYLLKDQASATVTMEQYDAAWMALQGSVPTYSMVGDRTIEAPPAAFGMQCDDAYLDGDTLTITGQLMAGFPGSGSAAAAAGASASFVKRGDAWVINGFEIM